MFLSVFICFAYFIKFLQINNPVISILSFMSAINLKLDKRKKPFLCNNSKKVKARNHYYIYTSCI